jgi:uncharacterized membrane protein
MSTARFEAFSDGVFAIAATVLVVDFRTPRTLSEAINAAVLFSSLWPQLVGYATSFAVIGVIWINHHTLFHFLKRVDRFTLIINLGLLMCVAFIPYPTALITEYGTSRPVIMLFGSTMALAGVAFSALWFYAVHQYLGTERHIDDRFVRDASLWTLGYPAAYAAATLFAFISIRVSIVLYAVIPAVYLLPGVIDRQLHVEMADRSYLRHDENEDSGRA